MAAAIKNDPQFTLCDTWSIFADKNGDPPKDEFPDLLHPNAMGYAKWEAALKPIFAKLEPGTQNAVIDLSLAHRQMHIDGDGLRARANVEFFVNPPDVSVHGLHA